MSSKDARETPVAGSDPKTIERVRYNENITMGEIVCLHYIAKLVLMSFDECVWIRFSSISTAPEVDEHDCTMNAA